MLRHPGYRTKLLAEIDIRTAIHIWELFGSSNHQGYTLDREAYRPLAFEERYRHPRAVSWDDQWRKHCRLTVDQTVHKILNKRSGFALEVVMPAFAWVWFERNKLNQISLRFDLGWETSDRDDGVFNEVREILERGDEHRISESLLRENTKPHHADDLTHMLKLGMLPDQKALVELFVSDGDYVDVATKLLYIEPAEIKEDEFCDLIAAGVKAHEPV